MKLSILIPSITERLESLEYLLSKIENQIQDKQVEVVVFIDNRKRSIGEKRQNILDLANGEYISIIDDDDDISNDFIEKIMTAIETHSPDVITFDQLADLDGKTLTVSFSLGNENEGAQIDENGNFGNIKRKPFHMCVWKKELVKDCKFPKINYGEDAQWVDCAVTKVNTETHINEILHFYKFSSDGTRAF